MMTTVSPDMFPGDPVRAAAAIYEVVASESPRHWVVLGSDAQRRIGAKLDMLRAEFEAGADTARSTDYPGSAEAVLWSVRGSGERGKRGPPGPRRDGRTSRWPPPLPRPGAE